ncbi:hypothetical protein L1987_40067 [Smallanthus sonchifolius]|uniref:Uncharacterized protein n=1 Tax=Smallanthus sonchifolius TaxID=185202 RepID=A0ACB9GS13_9ASTR|nr:hypothetical protein L1987_40067 [Smallanthus sonchifolius]
MALSFYQKLLRFCRRVGGIEVADAVGGRTSLSAKENGVGKGAVNGPNRSMPQGQINKDISVARSSSRAVPEGIAVNTNIVPAAHSSLGSDKKSEVGPTVGVWSGIADGRESKSQPNPVEQIHATPLEIKSTASVSKVGIFSMQGKAPVTHVSFSTSRPSSSYNNTAQQAIGPQKAIKMPTVPVESQTSNPSAAGDSSLKDTTGGLVKKLEEAHISDDQHVIIPKHLHVPEAEKLGFCFGSFDASFNATSSNGPGSGTVSDISSNASEVVDESIDEQPRNYNASETADEDHPDCPSSSNNIPEDLSAVGDVSSNAGPDYQESKQETLLPTATHQYPIVHTSPNFSFGYIPPMIGTHLTSFETESQAQVSNFVVQQPVDPASYYAQFYRSGADVDGRLSPFHSTGVPAKLMFRCYLHRILNLLKRLWEDTGWELTNVVWCWSNTDCQHTNWCGHANLHSCCSTTITGFQAANRGSFTHYPPNYIPYPYFSHFYVPPPAIHQFLSNNVFPQQPQAGSMSPGPPVGTPKYPLPQYKTGSNTGNPINIAMPGSYGPYGLNPAGYNSGSSATAGNSTSNEDLGGSQFMESNVYITGQQSSCSSIKMLAAVDENQNQQRRLAAVVLMCRWVVAMVESVRGKYTLGLGELWEIRASTSTSEGSGVWLTAPGRDMSGLQANSFYNIPQGGQVSYTPTQASHGSFASIYHPAQPVTTSAVHPLLQQSQTLAGAGFDMVPPSPQINWPNNY